MKDSMIGHRLIRGHNVLGDLGSHMPFRNNSASTFIQNAVSRWTLAVALITTSLPSCSSPDRTQGASDLKGFSGKVFSDLVSEHPEFRVSGRSISRQKLGVYSNSDGIEVPGELKQLNGRDLLIFYTCAPDRCSSSSNVIVVDLRDKSMHVVHLENRALTVLVEGAPDVAEFVKSNCRGTSCSSKSATG